VELTKIDDVSPISLPYAFMRSANFASLCEMPSARAIAASLATTIVMPRMRSRTVTWVFGRANMVVVRAGAPPVRHAFSESLNGADGASQPRLISLNTTESVISLARLAGGNGASASLV
jgi:hypothetical protein